MRTQSWERNIPVKSAGTAVETLYHSTMKSPVGPLTLGASRKGLAVLSFADSDLPSVYRGNTLQWIESKEEMAPFIAELEEYFNQRRQAFTMPLDLRGTDFQKRCWNALLQIPYGETRSYADIARAVGSPRAFRAVGMANHYNPVAIVVPCHRVIASGGGLGGYGGGLPLKEKLLRLERETLAGNFAPVTSHASSPNRSYSHSSDTVVSG